MKHSRIPWILRLVAAILLPVQLLTMAPGQLMAAVGNSGASRKVTFTPPPPKKVKVNRAERKVEIIQPKLKFSKAPADIEIRTARVFLEPLLPTDDDFNAKENTALAHALLSFHKRTAVENDSALVSFLGKYPQSRWRAALEYNLGVLHYQTGYLTKALQNWQTSWELLKDKTSPELKAFGDMAFGDLMELNCRVGRTEEMGVLLSRVPERKFIGSAAQKVQFAKEGYTIMRKTPEVGFKCGPFALDTIRTANHYRHRRSKIVEGAKSTSRGTSLAQVQDWADKLKLKYQPARRAPGSAFIVPSVIHWKLNHFAALVREQNGKYLVQDPTFLGGELWVTKEALETETDGYFLVPAGPLPEGWIAISRKEASQIWGKGGSSSQNGQHNDEKKNGCPPNKGMAGASTFLMTTDLTLRDTPLVYEVPVGPQVDLTVRYNYREMNQPANFTFTNFGASWVFNYLSYLTVDASQNVTLSSRGGGVQIYNYSALNNVTNVFPPDVNTQATLALVSTGNYERRLPDGTREIFNQPDGTGRIFLKQIIDAQGNSLILNYNANFRLTSVQDAIGQLTTFTYVSDTVGNSGYYKVQRITDPFGRYAQFQYDSTNTQLLKITDVIGIESQFTYDTGNFIDSLVTPYGKTLFYQYTPPGETLGRGLRITWPDGTKSITENYLGHETNTYSWDRKQSAHYPDKSKAEVTHWLMDPGSNVESSVPQSIKQPLEGVVTFAYPNGGSAEITPGDGTNPPDIHYYTGTSNLPISISRTLDNGSTQTYQYRYNDFGRVSQYVDPAGRSFKLYYDANNLDLLEVRQTRNGNNDLLAKFTYNSQHRPLTYQNGSGQKTFFTYNARGQVLTITDAKGGVTTYNYNTNGYLTSIDGPLSGTLDSTSFTYDGYGRLYTATDSEGYTLTLGYDTLNRLVSATYPDGSYEQVTWDRLDPAFFRDRLGNWTTRQYTPIQQLAQETDSLGRTTKFAWCTCGSLASLTDAAGHTTSWARDIQGRMTQKTFADSTAITYTYENTTSRLKQVTDALGQKTNYSYNLDNSLYQMSYIDTVHATSTLTCGYDPNYPRLTSVANGWGTVGYVYNNYITDPYATATTGSGRMQKVTNSVLGSSADITFVYDELDRVTNRSVNGSANPTTWNYDAMSRVTTLSNPLGSFGYNYLDASKGVTRLSSVNYPNNQITNYAWYGNNGDQRLQTIQNLGPASAALSQFDYTYDAKGQITSWKQQSDGNPANRYDFGYDPAGQLTSAVYKTDSTNGVLKQYFYNYDPAGNRTSEQIDTGVTQGTFNNVNQLTSLSGGGKTRVQGTINEPGTVTVNGTPAQMLTSTNFVANPVLPTGTSTVTISATDGSGNVRTSSYSINITAGASGTLSYDLAGNCTNNGQGQTYEWDAENRLIAINYTDSSRSEFTYDGLSRRVKIVEKDSSGTVISTKQFVWDGMQIIEERDGSGVVTKRFYPQGQRDVVNSANSFYTRDHLGSVRELVDANGRVAAAYDYDPYGRQDTSLPTNGLQVWLKADSLAQTDGTPVSEWADQSGNGNNATQTNTTAQPLYKTNQLNGQPVLRFDGSNDELHGNTGFDPGAADSTVFCVHKHNAMGGRYDTVLSFNVPAGYTRRPLLTWRLFSNTFGLNDAGVSDNGVFVDLTAESTAYHVSSYTRKDGTNGNGAKITVRSFALNHTLYQAVGSQTWTSGTGATTYSLGKHWDGGSGFNYLNGDVAEVVVYNRALTPAEQTRVETYLAQKYNRNHPASDFRYTGHYHHAKSGLALAPFRAYDPDLGRWLSRDPIEEAGGINLYGYVINDPVTLFDPDGFQPTSSQGGNNTSGGSNTTGNGNSGMSNPVPPVTPAQASSLRQSGLSPNQLSMLQRIGKNGAFNLKMMPKNALDSFNNYISKGQKVPGCIKGGEVFKNKEGKLPVTDPNGKPIEYKEWDFNPTSDPKQRGLERIITGSDGSNYYTPDHYDTFYPF